MRKRQAAAITWDQSKITAIRMHLGLQWSAFTIFVISVEVNDMHKRGDEQSAPVKQDTRRGHLLYLQFPEPTLDSWVHGLDSGQSTWKSERSGAKHLPETCQQMTERQQMSPATLSFQDNEAGSVAELG